MSAPAAEPRYPYVVVELSETEVDDASELLFDLGASGLEQRDDPGPEQRDDCSGTRRDDSGLERRDETASSASGPAARVTLSAAFPTEADARAAVEALPPSWSPRLTHVVGDAWRDEWKKYFEPFRLCEGVVVCPPWRTWAAAPGEQLVILEPGRAFGTGLHETTRLVAEALAQMAASLRGVEVLDVGCGSGVLSLAALALGAARVRALDVDPEAVAVTRENAARNGVAARIDADATAAGDLPGRYPVVVANIEATPLIGLADALVRRTAPGGALVLSGILGPETGAQWTRVRDAYAELHVARVRTSGEWLAAILRA